LNEIIAAGMFMLLCQLGFGRSSVTKPVLAMARPGFIVLYNSYKYQEYARLTLIGRKLGLRICVQAKTRQVRPIERADVDYGRAS
jgi:arginine decarboxylase-like protein